jgi:hypothetical protein
MLTTTFYPIAQFYKLRSSNTWEVDGVLITWEFKPIDLIRSLVGSLRHFELTRALSSLLLSHVPLSLGVGKLLHQNFMVHTHMFFQVQLSPQGCLPLSY